MSYKKILAICVLFSIQTSCTGALNYIIPSRRWQDSLTSTEESRTYDEYYKTYQNPSKGFPPKVVFSRNWEGSPQGKKSDAFFTPLPAVGASENNPYFLEQNPLPTDSDSRYRSVYQSTSYNNEVGEASPGRFLPSPSPVSESRDFNRSGSGFYGGRNGIAQNGRVPSTYQANPSPPPASGWWGGTALQATVGYGSRAGGVRGYNGFGGSANFNVSNERQGEWPSGGVPHGGGFPDGAQVGYGNPQGAGRPSGGAGWYTRQPQEGGRRSYGGGTNNSQGGLGRNEERYNQGFYPSN